MAPMGYNNWCRPYHNPGKVKAIKFSKKESSHRGKSAIVFKNIICLSSAFAAVNHKTNVDFLRKLYVVTLTARKNYEVATLSSGI